MFQNYEKQTAFLIDHHDEGYNLEDPDYGYDGFRVIDTTETLRERAWFVTDRHCSGWAQMYVPVTDIERMLSNILETYSNDKIKFEIEEHIDEEYPLLEDVIDDYSKRFEVDVCCC